MLMNPAAAARGGGFRRSPGMVFQWSQVLWLLLALPALVAAYVVLLRRRKKDVVRYADLGLVREALGPGNRIRRHVPPALLLVGLAAAIVAVARPQAVVTLPSEQRTIIMAMDVSLSMRAADVEPSRLQAAQAAAKAFVQDLPSDVRAGIVTFAGTAALVQPPTQNREDLVAAIDRFELQRHTAIGSGLLLSLATLFPEEGIELERYTTTGEKARGRPVDKERDDAKAARKSFTPVPPGSNTSAAIILLTDGRRTIGPNPLDIARICADHGVRVFTVGFGKPEGAMASVDGYSIYMAFDEETLRGIADVTKAEYFQASSAEALQKVYATLSTKFVMEKQRREVGALFAGGAALLLIAAAGLSLVWFGRAA
jgi:Ca-activated chloride channel family protein